MSDYEREALEAVERTLREADRSGPPSLDGVGLMRQSLERHRTDLRDRLAPALEAVLTGPHVDGHTIEVKFLVDALGPLQEVVTAVGQALDYEATDRAPVPSAVRDVTTMRVVSVFPGSFGVRIEGPPGDGTMSLFGEEDTPAPTFERSLDAVLDVLDAASSDDYEDAIRQTVAGLGRRTVAHLRSLAGAFAGGDDRMELRWRHRNQERVATFERAVADRIEGVLSTTEITERQVRMSGHLVGASLARKTFEFETTDETVIKGQVAPDVVNYLRLFFDTDCVATMNVSAARSTIDGTEQPSYLLLRLD